MGVKQVRENSINFKKMLQNTMFMHKYMYIMYMIMQVKQQSHHIHINNSMQRYMHKFFKRPVLAGSHNLFFYMQANVAYSSWHQKI